MTAGLVDDEYVDAFGRTQRVDATVVAAVREAMGHDPDSAVDPVAVVRPGALLPAVGDLVLEDGTELGRVSHMPRDAPIGYHRLHREDADPQLVITGPGRCHLPAGLREWGWVSQLATTRSSESWGIGDFADLERLAAWSGRIGAGFLAVSPLGAPNPGPQPEPSPYYPSTRRFLNPLHVAIRGVPGTEEIADLVAAGRALNGRETLDRGEALALKMHALQRAWDCRAFDEDAFAAWRRERGQPLERWALFTVLTERFGPGWQSWPEPYRRPSATAVSALADAEADRVAFHAWVQWCLDRQLAGAASHLRLVADMPVGVDPGGFDAWDWQEQLAIGASVGAPPDRFNVAGQDWGLPPFIPGRLRAAGYRPFIETIRDQLRHARGLRIDHVLGLFRMWWIPGGEDPARGAYVRYPTDELLEIVALESERAGAIVVGEDLGTVPPGVRRELRRRRLLSTRLALFERVAPSRYPRQAFAGVTTHDLPTIAGIITGSDLEAQAAAGIEPDADALDLLRRRLRAAAGVGEEDGIEAVARKVHRRLADAPPMLVGATLEDALRVEERPNIPGTVSAQRPNWSIALPEPLEAIERDARVSALVESLGR